jgi:hypothetical protein
MQIHCESGTPDGLQKIATINRLERDGRLERYFAGVKLRSLTLGEQAAARWNSTHFDDLAKLHHNYIVEHRLHGFQLARFLRAIPEAPTVISQATAVVVIGPGFGDEISIITPLTDAAIFAVEINPAAHPALAFERPWLKIFTAIEDLPELGTEVTFVANYVLAQPTLHDDFSMSNFAESLLDAAPTGFTMLSTLPFSSSYHNRSKFADEKLPADEILVAHLRAHGADVKFAMRVGPGPYFARLSTIEVGPR